MCQKIILIEQREKLCKSLRGSFNMQYTKLWDYAVELKRSNSGFAIILGTKDGDDGQ